MKIGDVVTFVDRTGRFHNALVIHVWGNFLNIAHVGVGTDSFGNEIVKETSVPYREKGMSGYYAPVTKPENVKTS